MDQPVRAATAKDNAFANLGCEILAQGPRGPSSSSAPTAAASSPASPPRSPATTPSPTAPPPPRHLSPAETSLAAVTQIEFADQLTVAASTTVPKAGGANCFL